MSLRNLGFSNLCGVDWTIAPDVREAGPSISFIAHDVTSYVPPDPIDVVVLNNVIEHIRDPHSLLTRYRGYLRTQGSIIIFTPNAQALSHAAFGRYWSGLHSPWHVQVFTRKSLAVLADQAGFQVSKMTADEDPGGWAISFQNWWRNVRRGAGRSTGSGFGVMTALALALSCARRAVRAGHRSRLVVAGNPEAGNGHRGDASWHSSFELNRAFPA